MGIYDMTVDGLPEPFKRKVTVVPNIEALNRKVAAEFADLLEEKTRAGELLTVIAPVGPLDYRYFADEAKRRGLSCRNLRTINMDEYVDRDDQLIATTHPLSFRRFMEETFFARLSEDERPPPENIIFPDPDAPEKVTELVDESSVALASPGTRIAKSWELTELISDLVGIMKEKDAIDYGHREYSSTILIICTDEYTLNYK